MTTPVYLTSTWPRHVVNGRPIAYQIELAADHTVRRVTFETDDRLQISILPEASGEIRVLTTDDAPAAAGIARDLLKRLVKDPQFGAAAASEIAATRGSITAGNALSTLALLAAKLG